MLAGQVDEAWMSCIHPMKSRSALVDSASTSLKSVSSCWPLVTAAMGSAPTWLAIARRCLMAWFIMVMPRAAAIVQFPTPSVAAITVARAATLRLISVASPDTWTCSALALRLGLLAVLVVVVGVVGLLRLVAELWLSLR